MRNRILLFTYYVSVILVCYFAFRYYWTNKQILCAEYYPKTFSACMVSR